MRHTPAQLDFIENMAEEQLRYETIFSDQAEVLRADSPNFKAAMAKIQQSPLIAKPGQQWKPTKDDADEYLAHCNDICQLVPQDFDERLEVLLSNVRSRVKILHAAHAALVCLVTCKTSGQPESVQLAILRRHHELSLAAYPTSPTVKSSQPPAIKPAVEPRRITAKELRFFQNPDNLHGKKFILSPDTDDPGMYEVIGYYKARDKGVRFDVLFDDCNDSIAVDEKEMANMLRDSLYMPV